MRKLGLVVLALLTALFSGCAVSAQGRGLSVVATVFPAYDFARSVGGELADVKMLIKPGTDVHGYEPTPQDILALEGADVILWIGGENEAWMGRLLDALDTADKQVVRLIDCVEPIYEQEHGHEHGEGPAADEHIWTSPVNAALMTGAIERAFSAADAGRASVYQENARAYAQELDALDAEFRAVADGAVRRELVFGDRFPFAYLAREYGLTAYAAFPNCTADTEPSARDVAALIDRVASDHLPVVYKIEQSSGRIAETIARETGAKVMVLDSCHNPTKAQLDAGETYVSVMKNNLEALREGLC